MLPYLGGSFGNPPRPTLSAGSPATRSTRPTSAWHRARWDGPRGGDHVGWYGSEQPGHQGRGVGRQAHGHRLVASAVEHHAVGHAMRHLERSASRWWRSRWTGTAGWIGRAGGGPGRANHARLGDAGQQRWSGRSSLSGRSRTGFGAPARASCSTSTRCRPRRRWISTCKELGADLLTISATSSRAPRASGRCGCGAARSCSRRSTAGARSVTAGPGRRTSREPSAWRSPTNAPARTGRRRRSGCARSAADSWPHVSRSRASS